MRPKTAGCKKTVGFALTGTKIEPPDDHKYQQNVTKFRNTKHEFLVAKAKEFETFHQIPRFTHALGAVIHPPPHREPREIWKPASTLAFDAAKVNLSVERFQSKNLPDHLVKPPIDEIALMRFKELEKSKSPQKKQRMSLKQEKEFKAEQKRKRDINIKISRAEKNLKTVFEDWKHLLQKAEEELLVADVQATIEQARFAEKDGKYVRFLFECFEAKTKYGGEIRKDIHTNVPSRRVHKNDLVAFLRFFKDSLNEAQATDIFMNLTKRLQAMLVPPKEAFDYEEANQAMDKNYNRRQNNPFLPNNNASMGRSINSTNNQDLMGISPSKKAGDQQQKQYGMTQ